MPTTKSAKKRLRQNLERRDRNRAVKSALKTQVRKVREAVAAGDTAKAAEELRLAGKQLDRQGARNVIHRNKAARTKSRLQKALKKAKQAGAAGAAK
jgi:small subunit ribosomal protein S20